MASAKITESETMTKDELMLLQMNARTMAHEIALRAIVRALSKQPALRETLQQCVADLPAVTAGRTIPGATADYSMLLAGETEEALQDLSRALLRELDQ